VGSTPAEGTKSTFRSKAYKLADEPGLYLTVNPSSNKRWRLKYRIGSQEKLSAIGIYPDVTLKMESGKDKFLTLLYKDLLKVDLADLDFGFYRILKVRREEVKAFFGQRLPEISAAAMQGQAADRATQVRNRLRALTDSLETAAPTLGLAGAFTDGRLDEHLAALPAGRDYLALIEELDRLEAAAGFTQSEEERLYNHLYLFVFRPLNTKEETHWKGNGAIQDQIAELAVPQLRKRLKPGLDGDRLARHVRRYTRKHRIDYFVHPALGAFLKAELDWYLKNEFLDQPF
jgi:hypothetical protein